MAKEGSSSVIVGLVKVKVVRGTNLAVRDVFSSDPYIVLKLGSQEVRTRTVKKNTNPVWNEDLTLTVEDLNDLLVTLEVYDRDTFVDDPMGAAFFELRPLVEAAAEAATATSRRRRTTSGVDSKEDGAGVVLRTVAPSSGNCLVAGSSVVWSASAGKAAQSLVLRLGGVECGEVELQLELEWHGHGGAATPQ
uniref:C2 domain-containing protein n=1 Tax=Oryza punctata TaxID=4537 RepID=A0A0E0LK94_ORYPU